MRILLYIVYDEYDYTKFFLYNLIIDNNLTYCLLVQVRNLNTFSIMF